MDIESTNLHQTPRCPVVLNLQSKTGQYLDKIVSEIAPTNVSVFLVGESGTGKDTLAREIHHRSKQKDRGFRRFDCAVNDDLSFKTEFTRWSDASADSNGIGTIYLDNLHDLDTGIQRSLLVALRDLEESNLAFGSTPRLISSSPSNLESLVARGHFRQEIYFRLVSITLTIPPLRERIEDIEPLTEYFLCNFSAKLKKQAPMLSPDVLRQLCDYSWPGNIRELANVTLNAVLHEDFRLALNEMKMSVPKALRDISSGPGASLKRAARAASEKAERELILRTLDRTRWNRKKAALELQVSYKSLLIKIKQIGLTGPELHA